MPRIAAAIAMSVALSGPGHAMAWPGSPPWPSRSIVVSQDHVPMPLGFMRAAREEVARPEIVELRTGMRLRASTSLLDWLSAGVESKTAEWTSRATRVDDRSAARLDTRAHAFLVTTSIEHPMTPRFSVHARVGLARTRTWTFIDGTTIVRDATTLPWLGLGARWQPAPGMRLTTDYGKDSDELWALRAHLSWTF